MNRQEFFGVIIGLFVMRKVKVPEVNVLTKEMLINIRNKMRACRIPPPYYYIVPTWYTQEEINKIHSMGFKELKNEIS